MRALFFDDHRHRIRRHRFDIGPISSFRIGHDGRWIAVDQNNFIPLFLQGLTRLGPRVVKLTRLADNNGAGADDHDFVNVGALWHGGSLEFKHQHYLLVID